MATPGQMSKKLIPDKSGAGLNSPGYSVTSQSTKKKFHSKAKRGGHERTSSVVTQPKFLNPEYAGMSK
jgi:hypothetical protein